MNPRAKLALDLIIGTVIPVFILSNLSNQLGTVTAYVVAALVPVSWVISDLLFISRRFNFVTSYVGVFTVVGGLLSFWFVDGVHYAFKDSLGSLFTVGVFGLSVLLGKPIMYYFSRQAFSPSTPEQETSLNALFKEPPIQRAFLTGTIMIMLVNLITGTVNFFLNLNTVIADFGTAAFNQQVAQVNAITRVALGLPEYGAVFVAIYLIRRAVQTYLMRMTTKRFGIY